MKQLKDLKQEILDNKINNFYVFYGNDFGLRKHYINKLAEKFDKIKVIMSAENFTNNTTTGTLFKLNTLYILYNDLEFCKQNVAYINTFIKKIGTDMVIVDYEDLPEKCTLMEHFENSITKFSNVQDSIAYEFIDSEITISPGSKKQMAYNCNNNYNSILLEADKVKQYSQYKNINEQMAYDSLDEREQLIFRYMDYNVDLFMNDILTRNISNFPYWIQTIKTIHTDNFWMLLSRVFADLLIAYLVKQYGKYPGSSKAYEYKLSWTRAKVIRELSIPYTAQELLIMTSAVCDLDYKVKTGILQEEPIDYLMCLFV